MARKFGFYVVIMVITITLILGGGITVFAIEYNKLGENEPILTMENINEVLLSSSSINIYKNGQRIVVDRESVNPILSEMLDGCRLMPAFGVALDNEVREAINTGIWLELVYDKEYQFEGMPFDKLLIEVGSDYSGFNVMRHHGGQYEGRCYYVDLVNKNMNELEVFIQNI